MNGGSSSNASGLPLLAQEYSGASRPTGADGLTSGNSAMDASAGALAAAGVKGGANSRLWSALVDDSFRRGAASAAVPPGTHREWLHIDAFGNIGMVEVGGTGRWAVQRGSHRGC